MTVLKKPKAGFANAKAFHLKDPDTFEIPSPEDLAGITTGDFIKAGVNVHSPSPKASVVTQELMWFRVLRVEGATFRAQLDNTPGWSDVHQLVLGDVVNINKDEVYSIDKV